MRRVNWENFKFWRRYQLSHHHTHSVFRWRRIFSRFSLDFSAVSSTLDVISIFHRKNIQTGARPLSPFFADSTLTCTLNFISVRFTRKKKFWDEEKKILCNFQSRLSPHLSYSDVKIAFSLSKLLCAHNSKCKFEVWWKIAVQEIFNYKNLNF